MRALGVPFDKTVVANLETGRRRFVTVQELLALAYVLDVAPVNLLVPIDGTDPVEPVPGVTVSAAAARAWIRGQDVIGDGNLSRVASQAPSSDFVIQGAWARLEESERPKAEAAAAQLGISYEQYLREYGLPVRTTDGQR